MSIILKSVSHTSKNSPESNIASIRLKFLVLIYQGQGVNLKKLTQSHHSQQNKHFYRFFFDIPIKKITVKISNYKLCFFLGSGHRMLFQLSIKVVFEIPNNLVRIKSFSK